MTTRKPDILNTTLLDAEQLAQHSFHVEDVHLKFSNGEERHYRRMANQGHGAVLIVPMLDDDTVLLIREYAVGVDGYELQCPKGRVDPGETFDQTANRELKEEIGMGARQLEHINTLSIVPGFMSHQTQIFMARDLYEERLPGDEPEDLEVVPWSIHKLDELITRADCTEARSIAALYQVYHRLHK